MRIHSAIEEGYEFPAGDVAGNECIQLAANCGGTGMGGGEGAKRRLQVRHKQCGGDALSTTPPMQMASRCSSRATTS